MSNSALREISAIGLPTQLLSPEPRSGLGKMFRSLMQAGGQFLGLGDVSSQNAALIQEQIAQQQQMQLVSLISNVEKSKHETAMTPLRNIRVA